MNEMINRLLEDGWNWVFKEEEQVFIYENKPEIREGVPVYSRRSFVAPSCLFDKTLPDNSLIHLRNLLLSCDENEDKDQKNIRMWLSDERGYKYLIRDYRNIVFAVTEDELLASETCELDHLCPNKYEKVFLETLLTKPKVKRRLNVFKNTFGQIVVVNEDNTRAILIPEENSIPYFMNLDYEKELYYYEYEDETNCS